MKWVEYLTEHPDHPCKLVVDSGAYSRHLNKTKALYKQKRKFIINLLKKYDYINIDYQNSYLSLIIDINDFDKIKFKELCKNNSIDISIMEDYYLDNKKDNRIVIGYSGIEINKIEKGINKLLEIINNVRKK